MTETLQPPPEQVMTADPAERTTPLPVLLTVDDDPSVSRSVARDLRRQYGSQYRIVRADSGPDALDALKEINVVDVDHYLLKPWEPPQEKLYPVVDELLDMWMATGDSPRTEIRVVGHRWSQPSYLIRDFLASNGIPYRWYSDDEPEGEQLLAAADAGRESVPLVVLPDGTALAHPSTTEVAEKVGLHTVPAGEFYDLVIIGGGPAGLGAAVYGASEGLRTVLIERQATGGRAGQSSRIENYLGFPDGVSGGQLTERARRQAEKFGAELLTARQVTSLEVRGPRRVVHFHNGTEIAAHAVLLATGVAYRELTASGADRLTGRGVYYGSASTEAAACAGQSVVIVGGANSAGQTRCQGHPRRTRSQSGALHVQLSHRPGPEYPEHRRTDLHDGHRLPGRASPGMPDPAR